uniref:Uncharacterized protein n=1 Tax=Rhizophora mucronata TaxID=61149 RepID=A0A2P2PBZ7_RHIMU
MHSEFSCCEPVICQNSLEKRSEDQFPWAKLITQTLDHMLILWMKNPIFSATNKHDNFKANSRRVKSRVSTACSLQVGIHEIICFMFSPSTSSRETKIKQQWG